MIIEGWSTRINPFHRGSGLAGVALALTLATASPAEAGTPYDAGKMRIGIGGGLGANSWGIAAGFGYYVVDGLELRIDGAYLFAGDQSYGDLSPGVRFVLFFVPTIQPYVGAFYQHRFYRTQPDLDGVGADGGLLYAFDYGYIGVGAAYLHPLKTYEDVVYPEIMLGISF